MPGFQGAHTVLDSANLKTSFIQAYNGAVSSGWANQLVFTQPSDRAVEDYLIPGGAPEMAEWRGARNVNGMKFFPMVVQNKPYDATLNIKVADMRRDRTGLIQMQIQEMAAKAATFVDNLVIDLVNNVSSYTGYDGEYLLDTDHDEWSTNQTNALTATEIPSANVTTATAPTATELSNVINETVGYMHGYRDSQGSPVNGNARSFTVIVSTAPLYNAAAGALGLAFLANGVSNPIFSNPQQGMLNGYKFNLVLEPRLTSATDKVIIARNDTSFKPFLLQDEYGIELGVLGEGSDHAYLKDEWLFSASCSRAVAPLNWKAIARVTLS